ncbi:MAG TPA: ATP-binding protein [Candidatus Pacearchaeota archaeon]|nr:ATP-binding protein [Candidatus Pacearchaeota archaeon]HDZ60969.1 ATP-binding protein [Candidatus Pacearchaeota archaeon]
MNNIIKNCSLNRKIYILTIPINVMVSRELLKEILSEQQKRTEKLQKQNFVQREKLGHLKKFLRIKQSIIITGVRRCGKSVLMLQIIKNFYKNFYYINFEDERLADFKLKDFNRLYEVCIELFGKNKTFFLDEIQNVEGWERWVRRMYEDDFKFFITGSNARLLSKELATLLTGRHLQFTIFPFSFKEFLKFYNFDLNKRDIYLTEKRASIKKYFSKYIVDGGFPECIKNHKIEILQEYFSDIIQKDLVERFKIEDTKKLKELARYVLTNSGKLTTYNRLRGLTEIKSVNTIIKYLSYLEDAYLMFSVPYFSYSLRKQMANPFKIYSIDTGLANAVSFKFSKDVGRAYETVVAIELKRRDKEFYYWKNTLHEEVDFVLKEKLKIKQLIQVCYDIEDYDTKKREIKSLLKAGKELKCRNLLIITDEKEDEEIIKNNKIKYVPLWKWLLSEK